MTGVQTCALPIYKPTEPAIKNEIARDPNMIAANTKLLNLNRELALATALKDAFVARGYALRDLVQLYCSNYYGSEMDRPRGAMRNSNADANRSELSRQRAAAR